MNRKQLLNSFDTIISLDNLLLAWQEFLCGKKNKKDVQEFQLRLMDNLISLHADLKNKTYRHGGYKAFNISDPKPRNIHKASVRDRLLHHAIYRVLYPFFDRTFIADSYSCRLGRGTHKALKRFKVFSNKVTKNNTRTAYVLKCDIRKFFASVDHGVLVEILKKYIPDTEIVWLLQEIIESFHTSQLFVGLPLGNLTSQLFVNIYMNEFDQFVKHNLKAKYYIRYADDFVFMSDDKEWLLKILPQVKVFLQEKLHLELHPKKVSIKTIASGVDFLGWVHFPDHRVLRGTTKGKVIRVLRQDASIETLMSYHGLLKHGNEYGLQKDIENFLHFFLNARQ